MKTRYYSPQISRLLVCALYHEAQRRRTPMTKLVDEFIMGALRESESLAVASQRFGVCGTPAGLSTSDGPNGDDDSESAAHAFRRLASVCRIALLKSLRAECTAKALP